MTSPSKLNEFSTLDRDLSSKPHAAIMLKKAYAKIAALRRIQRLVPSDVMISLFKAYVLPHLEFGYLWLLPCNGCYGHAWAKTYPAIAYSFCKCFKLDGPNYISRFFTTRLIIYSLRGSGLNVVQPPYNTLVVDNSYLYMIAHIWNRLPYVAKFSTTLAQFRARLNNVKFTGCQCMNCI